MNLHSRTPSDISQALEEAINKCHGVRMAQTHHGIHIGRHVHFQGTQWKWNYNTIEAITTIFESLWCQTRKASNNFFKKLRLLSSNLKEFAAGMDVDSPLCSHAIHDELYKRWISFGVTLYSRDHVPEAVASSKLVKTLLFTIVFVKSPQPATWRPERTGTDTQRPATEEVPCSLSSTASAARAPPHRRCHATHPKWPTDGVMTSIGSSVFR